jgi:plastocyanin
VTRHGARRAAGLALVALVLAACATAGSAGPPPTAPPGGTLIVADDLAFSPRTVAVAAGTPFGLVFENREGAPHNITILDGRGVELFVGEVFSGPGWRAYAVPALAAGQLSFRCDVHAAMTGTLVAG